MWVPGQSGVVRDGPGWSGMVRGDPGTNTAILNMFKIAGVVRDGPGRSGRMLQSGVVRDGPCSDRGSSGKVRSGTVLFRGDPACRLDLPRMNTAVRVRARTTPDHPGPTQDSPGTHTD